MDLCAPATHIVEMGMAEPHILIVGATGFIGQTLSRTMRRKGWHVVAAVRSISRAYEQLGHAAQLTPLHNDELMKVALSKSEVVVNFAGEPIFPKRWSGSRRRLLWDSRIGTTQRLNHLIEQSGQRPRLFINVSAVGYYGDCGDKIIDEAFPQGQGFLADLCHEWEQAALKSPAERIFIPRLGIVLGRSGGMLAQMIPMFARGLGACPGSGQNYLPWVHLDDVVGAMMQAIEQSTYAGIYNLTAPAPVTLQDFCINLAQRLNRRLLPSVPAGFLRLVFGESSSALLGSQRAIPKKLQDLGHSFRFNTLQAALDDLL